MNKKVDTYFQNLKKWQPELVQLRDLVLKCGLTETYKWRNPCYTYQDKNIVLMGYTKEAIVLSFLKGELIKDPEKILKKAGPNSRATKYISFKSLEEIQDKSRLIKNYLNEAIQIEIKGLKIDFSKNKTLEYPIELVNYFKENPKIKAAFTTLTPGRQRGYILHFSSAKQPKTKIARIKKYEARILKGKGMLDCVCGHSKRMPNCDGSHKLFK